MMMDTTSLRLSLLLVLFSGLAEAFVTPTLLSGRGNALCSRGWGTGIDRARAQLVYDGASQRSSGAMVPARMSFGLGDVGVLLADSNGDAELPIGGDVQDTVVSALSVASSLLLFVIVAGAIFLTFSEWKNNQDMQKGEEFVKSTGALPPNIAPKKEPTADGEEDEGNRQYRRMARKQKQKMDKKKA